MSQNNNKIIVYHFYHIKTKILILNNYKTNEKQMNNKHIYD